MCSHVTRRAVYPGGTRTRTRPDRSASHSLANAGMRRYHHPAAWRECGDEKGHPQTERENLANEGN